MNELQANNEPVSYDIEQKHSDSYFNEIAQSGLRFLPRLQLFSGNSEAVKGGLMPVGHYGLVTGKNKIIPLGKEVDILAFVWRPKAIDMSNTDKIVAVFEPSDPMFQEIQERSSEQDSGCVYGPEFLVWIPQLERFATLLFGSKSARMEAPNLKSRLQKPTTLQVDLAKKGRNSWHVIVVNQCSTPFPWPAKELVQEQVKNFNNPPVKEEQEPDVTPVTRDV